MRFNWGFSFGGLMGLSAKAVVAIKLSQRRQYQLAQSAGLHPSTLSKLINGIERVKKDDPKVLRLAEVLGIPSQEMIDEDANGWSDQKRKGQ
jgi:hypothetical protein